MQALVRDATAAAMRAMLVVVGRVVTEPAAVQVTAHAVAAVLVVVARPGTWRVLVVPMAAGTRQLYSS